MHTVSRVLDDTCQYPTLFFKKDRFRIMEGDEFWLSKTPEIHRSKNWDSAFPRMLSTATVEALELGQVFSVAVTHLDHMGLKARLKQAEIIARWVHKRTVPVILMGDFNAFTGIPQKSRIDWILTTVPPHIVEARIVHDQLDGRYASDHFPYYVDLSWDD